jgi:hypothetical protein
METLYRVEAQEDWRDNRTFYNCEVVARNEDHAQIIARQELEYLFSMWGDLSFNVLDIDDAKDQPKFKLRYYSDYEGNLTCWGCHNVTAIGEKDQCECKS